MVGFAEAMSAGTEECLDNEAGSQMKNLYEPLEIKFKGNWEAWSKSERASRKKKFGIYFGGYLSYDAAKRVAPFLRDILKLKARPFPARPRLDG